MRLPFNIIYWAKILSKFVSIQIVVQALTLVSGIFLVRTLSQKEYAYYTIATSMQGTMTILADMGISIGLSAIGGKVWQNKYRFGQLINTALHLRYYLAAASILFVAPISIWMLSRNGASLWYAASITMMVLLGLNFQLTIGVLNIVPRLHSQINQIQKLDLVFNISRIVLLGVSYLTLFNTVVVTFMASLALGIQRFFLGNLVADNIDRKAPLNNEDSAEILKIIKQSAPNTIFYCFQGQLTVWLLSIFGSVETVAEIGALGRLAVIFAVIGSVMTGIVLPSFARCQSPKFLFRRYAQILATISLFSAALVALAALFPNQLLWIIGSKYSHLQSELILVIVSSGLLFVVNTMWSLNATKAWLNLVWLQIPGVLIAQIITLILIDVSTLKGAIIFGMAPLIPGFILNSFMTYKGFKNISQNI
jgi:O-antigen/teichoic acid export membrane protein